MNVLAESAALLNSLDGGWLTAPAGLIADALIKVTLVFGLAALATLALGKASAAARHLVWALALGCALILPVLSVALPRWQLPVVTLKTAAFAPPAIEPSVPQPAQLNVKPETDRNHSRSTTVSNHQSIPAATTAPAAITMPSVATLLGAVWAIGAIAVIARLLLGLVAVQWMSRRTVRVVDAPWLPLAMELATELGITRRLRFLESARATMPMASGIFTPAVLMPEDANRWPLERLRIVLLHELAHVKRRDCLTHVVAQLACALHWFNPLVWMAARHVRTERERACDDLVLACGTRGPDYAEELLEIARVMRSGRYPALLAGATLAMAHRSQLEGRLIAILDPKLPRAGVSPARSLVAAVAVACVLPPLAAMQPWTVTAAEAGVVEPSATEPKATPQPSPVPQAAAAPRPEPTAAPQASIDTNMRHQVTTQISQNISDSVAQEAVVRAQAAVQGAVQGAIQSDVQSLWQTTVQNVVQGAVQGAVQGTTVQADGKRAAADPRMVAALTAALKDSDKEVRETAMHALVQLRDPAVFEPLVQALKDSSPDVREQAAHGLAQLRDKRAADPLMGALKDSNANVREAAIHGLAQLRDPRAVDGLISALKDESPDVREQAASALGQLRDPRAVDPLIAALKDENGDVREQAVFALGQMRDKRSTTAIAGLIKDTNADVRQQAVFALGQLRDPSAIEGLTLALRDVKPDVREQAAFALGQIRDPRSVQPLISSLKDEAADVREQAAFALGQIRDRGAVEALVIAIKDPAADVREQVAFALGQIRDPRAIDALTTALKDTSADVRQQAAFALGQLAR
jgi:HEAT repeat protein/beta-lactamase regulating signal transducer with metallopeptidase domain